MESVTLLQTGHVNFVQFLMKTILSVQFTENKFENSKFQIFSAFFELFHEGTKKFRNNFYSSKNGKEKEFFI